MNVKRLKMAHAALLAYAKNPGNLKFDLGTWLSLPMAYMYTVKDESRAARAALAGDNFCGTTACACGLFGLLPEFRREGFTTTREGTISYRPRPGGYSLGHFDAILAFFDISFSDALELFDVGGYLHKDINDPLAVADKIYALLQVER